MVVTLLSHRFILRAFAYDRVVWLVRCRRLMPKTRSLEKCAALMAHAPRNAPVQQGLKGGISKPFRTKYIIMSLVCHVYPINTSPSTQ